MTGYGRGMAGGFRVEVRSCNHKNLDININLPSYLFHHDPEIRKQIKKNFSRGRIDVFIPRQEVEGVKLKVNKSLAAEYYKALTSLKEELSIEGGIGIDFLASQRDIISMDEAEIDLGDLNKALGTAIEELITTRVEEGVNLIDDITERLDLIENQLKAVEDKRQAIVDAAGTRLRERLIDLLGNTPIDETRIVQETAILIERSDITEEIVRIKSHFKQFRAILASGEAIGKKIDFFIQELRREVNTIGSKVQDVDVSTSVVNMKHEIEKIKEQVQNLQ